MGEAGGGDPTGRAESSSNSPAAEASVWSSAGDLASDHTNTFVTSSRYASSLRLAGISLAPDAACIHHLKAHSVMVRGPSSCLDPVCRLLRSCQISVLTSGQEPPQNGCSGVMSQGSVLLGCVLIKFPGGQEIGRRRSVCRDGSCFSHDQSTTGDVPGFLIPGKKRAEIVEVCGWCRRTRGPWCHNLSGAPKFLTAPQLTSEREK